jgi:hypothetical protein
MRRVVLVLALAALSVAACDKCGAPATQQSDATATGGAAGASNANATATDEGADAAVRAWPPPFLRSSWVASLEAVGGAHYGKSAVRAPDGTVYATFSNQGGVFSAGRAVFGGKYQSTLFAGYVAAFDDAGQATWAYSVPSNGVDTTTDALAVDAKHEVVFLTHWSALACKPPCELLGKERAEGSSGLVLQKIKRGARKPIWSRSLTTTGSVGGQTVIADASGKLFVSAWFDGDLRSEEMELTARADHTRRESLLFALTPGGKLLWSVHAPFVKEAMSPDHHLVLDKNGHAWTIPSLGPAGSLVSRLDETGHAAFSVTARIVHASAGDGDGIHARLLADFPDGSIAVLGVLQNASVDLEGVPLTAGPQRSMFIASFTPEGALRFARPLDAIGDVDLEHLVGLAGDTLVATGGSADFGATLALIPRAGAPVVYRQPLRSMQLEGITRVGPSELLVTGARETAVRREYRLLVQRFTLASP